MFRKGNSRIEMCEGPMLKNLIFYSIPLVITNVLQLMYNAIDIIIVGKYEGALALSAVGATSSTVSLLVNTFIGFSMGTLVMASRYYGARDPDGMHQIIHTSISISLVFGVFLAIVGCIFINPILLAMNTPDDVISGATLYATIFLIGTPFNLLFNFGAAILRAIGDTKRPLIFLTIAGISNVVLNLIFVIVFNMGVAGVALATIIAQGISSAFVINCLIKQDGYLKLEFKKLHVYTYQLGQIAKIGLPAAIQSSLFSLSNMLIQSSINIFGSFAIAGNAAASNLEAFIHTGSNSIQQGAVTFTSQNLGAKKYGRMRKVQPATLLLCIACSLTFSCIVFLLRYQLIGLYTSEPEVIEYAVYRVEFFCKIIVISGMLEVTIGHLRGLGHAMFPMLTTLFFVCCFRVFWIFVAFSHFQTLFVLYLSYPLSWAMSFVVVFIFSLVVKRHLPKKDLEEV